jgi:hypothetical protein
MFVTAVMEISGIFERLCPILQLARTGIPD